MRLFGASVVGMLIGFVAIQLIPDHPRLLWIIVALTSIWAITVAMILSSIESRRRP